MNDRSPHGIVSTTAEGGTAVNFEWYYDRPVEAVWAALTEPARLALWLADAEVDLRVGGHYRLRWRGESTSGMQGTIIELEAPRLLTYAWRETGHDLPSTVRWELATEERGCVLRLTHTFAPGDDSTPYLAGWHDYLYALLAAVDGYRSAYDRERERQIDQHYRALAGSGSPPRQL